MPHGTSNSHSLERCIKAATALLRGVGPQMLHIYESKGLYAT